MTYTTWRLPL